MRYTHSTRLHLVMIWVGAACLLMLLCCLVMAGMQQIQKVHDDGWGPRPTPLKIRVTGPRELKDARNGWGELRWDGLTAKQAGLPVDPWTGLHKEEEPVTR